jgi:hypothetical protein
LFLFLFFWWDWGLFNSALCLQSRTFYCLSHTSSPLVILESLEILAWAGLESWSSWCQPPSS